MRGESFMEYQSAEAVRVDVGVIWGIADQLMVVYGTVTAMWN